MLWEFKKVVNAAVQRLREFQGEDGGRYVNVVFHRVDRFSGDPDDLGKLRLGQSGSLTPFSQVRDEFHTIP